MSFDINTTDSHGNQWDFTKSDRRQRAREYVDKNKPLFIIGSPPCDQWSVMQNLDGGKCDPNEVQRKIVEAKICEFNVMYKSNCAECVRDAKASGATFTFTSWLSKLHHHWHHPHHFHSNHASGNI